MDAKLSTTRHQKQKILGYREENSIEPYYITRDFGSFLGWGSNEEAKNEQQIGIRGFNSC